MAKREPKAGEVIRGYRLERMLASGGMGTVWLGVHTTLGRAVAVKILDPQFTQDESYVRRFMQETRTVNDIRHPNIVEVVDFIATSERVALAMELIDGPNLADFLSSGPLTVLQSINICQQLVDALKHAHAARVWHRDLKPHNIMVLGSRDHDFFEIPSVKILDFGTAKGDGTLCTPAYMAPEQTSDVPVSPATDVYAVAELLYEMVAGRRLFLGSKAQVLTQKAKGVIPSIELPSTISSRDRLVGLIRSGLHQDPRRRPAVNDFAQGLWELRLQIDPDAPSGGEPETQPRVRVSARVSDTDFSEAHGGEVPTVLHHVDKPSRSRPDSPPADLNASVPDFSEGDIPNTHMFFQRIQEDIAEPEVEVAPEENLPKKPALPEHDYRYSPGPGDSEPQFASGGVPVIRGQPDFESRGVLPPRPAWPVPTAPRRFVSSKRRLVMAIVGGVVLAGGLAAYFRWGRSPSGMSWSLTEQLSDWRRQLGAGEGTADQLRAQALGQFRRDTWSGYVAARQAFRRSLLKDPRQPQTIGGYVENEMVGFARHLEPEELGVLAEWLDYADTMETRSAGLRRARALVQEVHDPGRLEKIIGQKAPQDILTVADLLHEAHSERALALLAKTQALPRSVRVRAKALMRRGRFFAAQTAIDRRLAKEPRNGLLFELRGRLLLTVGRAQEAYLDFDRALEADGDLWFVRVGMAESAIQMGRNSEADSILADVAQDPTAPVRLRAHVEVLRGELALDRGDWTEAQARGAASQALVPSLSARRILAEAAIGEGRGDEARQQLQAILSDTRDDLRSWLLAAVVELRMNPSKPAQAALARAARLAPDDARVVLLQGIAGLKAGNDQQPDTVGRLSKLDPYSGDGRARVRWMDRVLAYAESTFTRGQTSADAPLGYLLQGILRYHRKDMDGAQRALRQVAATGPGADKLRALTAVYYAHAYLGEGKLRSAERMVKGSAFGRFALARLTRARILGQRGRASAARRAYDASLALEPHLKMAQIERWALVHRSRPKEAQRNLIGLFRRNPSNVKLRRTLYDLGI